MTVSAYWNAILVEHQNKNNKDHAFNYTGYGERFNKEIAKTKLKKRRKRKKMLPKKYGLGEDYPDVYFTSREYDCISQMLQGKTIKGVAQLYKLSPRTVEFYIKNMKVKLECTTRAELLEKVALLEIAEIKE